MSSASIALVLVLTGRRIGGPRRESRERLLEAARSQEIDVVLVWRLDHWGRRSPQPNAILAGVGTRYRAGLSYYAAELKQCPS